ncbi:MAG: M28 family metallopeptidase [Gemmatimonadetes bacterium]|nr:M28 family metallopeptidase [Gemmatimonadota bacterium]
MTRATALTGTLLLLLGVTPMGASTQQIPQRDRDAAKQLIAAAMADHHAYDRLGYMVDTFGPRLAGSVALERTIDWILEEMKADGLDRVQVDSTMVPHWVRGSESLEMLEPRERKLPMLGLGGSIGTPPGGIRGEVLVVSSFDDLTAHAAQARGRIVLFDVPFTSYGETVRYRTQGASAAAKVGAIASLIRSVGPESMQSPHTGVMYYEDGVPEIPHAAVTLEDAEMIHRMQDRGQRVELLLNMEAQTLPDAPSRNAMAEVTGSEHPEEVVVLGGHSDSWDVGQGAMDDGGGVIAALEAVRLMRKLGLRPRRTVRVVAWVNEENGGAGGRQYAADHADEHHVLAIESDGGVFKPTGFGFTGSDQAMAVVRKVAELLQDVGSGTITSGGGGSDIGPLMQTGVPGMGLNVDDTRYFWYHHSDADTMDKLDPDDVARCVATMAVMAFVIADLPDSLSR